MLKSGRQAEKKWETSRRQLGRNRETSGRQVEDRWETSGRQVGKKWGTSGTHEGKVLAIPHLSFSCSSQLRQSRHQPLTLVPPSFLPQVRFSKPALTPAVLEVLF